MSTIVHRRTGRDMALVFVAIGMVLPVGLAAHQRGKRTALPRITVPILAGNVAGPDGADLVPASVPDGTALLNSAALVMVACPLGQQRFWRNVCR